MFASSNLAVLLSPLFIFLCTTTEIHGDATDGVEPPSKRCKKGKKKGGKGKKGRTYWGDDDELDECHPILSKYTLVGNGFCRDKYNNTYNSVIDMENAEGVLSCATECDGTYGKTLSYNGFSYAENDGCRCNFDGNFPDPSPVLQHPFETEDFLGVGPVTFNIVGPFVGDICYKRVDTSRLAFVELGRGECRDRDGRNYKDGAICLPTCDYGDGTMVNVTSTQDCQDFCSFLYADNPTWVGYTVDSIGIGADSFCGCHLSRGLGKICHIEEELDDTACYALHK